MVKSMPGLRRALQVSSSIYISRMKCNGFALYIWDVEERFDSDILDQRPMPETWHKRAVWGRHQAGTDSEKVSPFTKKLYLKGDMKMEFPEVRANNMYGFRFYSNMNPWIDFVVLVPKTVKDSAYVTLRHAIEAYWNDEYECYGDAVEDELNKREIPYVVIYHDSNDVSDEYEHKWDAMVENLVIMEDVV